MDAIVLNLRADNSPPPDDPVDGELSADEVDANFTALKTAAEQLDAEKLPITAAVVIDSALTELEGTDELIIKRGSTFYTTTLATLAEFVGVLPEATAPAALEAGDWLATAGVEEIDINILTLPDNGGSAITALQYRIDGGTAVDLTGTGTGVRTISGFTGGVEYDVEVRAVNAIGNGPWSDLKARTPTAEPTAPQAFEAGFWTATAGDGQIVLNLTTLPGNGGSAITALQYRIDGGTATNLTGTGTGERTLSGLTNTTEYDIEIRAVNAVGNGAWSDVKSRTPVAAGGAAAYINHSLTTGPAFLGSIDATLPDGAGSGDYLTAFAVAGADGVNIPAPAGWTARAAADTGDTESRARMFTAPADVATRLFEHTDLFAVILIATNKPLRAGFSFLGHYWGNNPGPNAPAPSVNATAGDAVVSLYSHFGEGASISGSAPAGYTREYLKNDANPMISIISREAAPAGATGTINHGDTADYFTRFLFTGSYGD